MCLNAFIPPEGMDLPLFVLQSKENLSGKFGNDFLEGLAEALGNY